jgi:hypothetical protein
MRYIVVILLCCGGFSEGMRNLPMPAIDGTLEHPEGKELSALHARGECCNGRWHLPKNQDELKLLYQAYHEGSFDASSDDCRGGGVVGTWKTILEFAVHRELNARFLDGDKYFVDKYLGYLETFVQLTTDPSSKYADPKFTHALYRMGEFDLYMEFGDFVNSGPGYLKNWKWRYPNITEELFLYMIRRFDDMLRPTGKYGPPEKYKGLMNYYRYTFCRPKTKQIEQMETAVQSAFEDGITVDVK